MEKINVAELLKDCPEGMELDCSICDGVKFIELDRSPNFPIVVRANNGYEFSLTKYGQVHNIADAKCVIFPKGKTTWEGFQRPFKDGDILATKNGLFIGIVKIENGVQQSAYVAINGINDLSRNISYRFERFATEGEKAKLFQAIKDNSYKWNAETKTLSKLVQHNFEVGNKIEKCGYSFIIAEVKDDYYLTKCGNKIPIDYQDDFSLVPNKFDITNLKPFDKVLIKCMDCKWKIAFYGYYDKDLQYPFVCTNGDTYDECIPYNDETEHLLGTTKDCDEYYKTWE